MQNQTDALCVNTIRMLSVDAVEKAKSGHPGAPMGLAPVGLCFMDALPKTQSEQSLMA